MEADAKRVASMHDFLQRLYAASVSHLSTLMFDKSNGVHRTLISLYSSIIEQADSAMTLRQQGKSAGVEMILRASLEAHADLINLASDAEYIKQMMFSYHKEWIKLATDGVENDNPFLVYFKDNPEAKAQLDDHKAELEALKKLVKPMHISEKFKMAGMASLYTSIYNSLCNESHNNIRALTARHFRVNEDGGAEIVIFDPMAPIDEAAALDAYIATLTTSSYIVHHYFESDSLSVFEGFRAQRDELGIDWTET